MGVTMIMIHVYYSRFGPMSWRLTRSMFRGWITSKDIPGPP